MPNLDSPFEIRVVSARVSTPIRRRRVLLGALMLSLVLHVALSMWEVSPPASIPDSPLTATITELPPPPAPVAATPAPPVRPAAKPQPRRPSPPRPIVEPANVATPDPAPPSMPATAGTPDAASANAGNEGSPEAPALTEDVAIPGSDVVQAKTLPPRVDLAYKVFFGTRGFQIGEATYRFEHANSRYRISTVGQARGLAALLVRGQGRIESTGIITSAGLQPLEFSFDRFSGRGREKAQFDWEAAVVTLDGEKTASLEIPTFDPLTLMWQYYFTPPDADRLSLSVATTRRVARYTVTREGRERLPWANGSIETERWVRVSDDGRTEAYAWLAPDLRYIPVKMRVTNTSRGTLEAVLDAIRVDATGETVGRDDMALRPSPPAQTHDRAAHDAIPGYSPPGATFPSMTP